MLPTTSNFPSVIFPVLATVPVSISPTKPPALRKASASFKSMAKASVIVPPSILPTYPPAELPWIIFSAIVFLPAHTSYP